MTPLRHAGLVALGGSGLMLASALAHADVGVGDEAPLFQTINENLEPVDMENMIDGRPLVLAVGSAS